MKVLSLLFGRHQAEYALTAVIASSFAYVAFEIGHVTVEKYHQSFAIYLMMYVSSMISALCYGDITTNKVESKTSFLWTFWTVCRTPYLATCLLTVIYSIALDPDVGRFLIYMEYAILICLAISVGAWCLKHRKRKE